jgi:general secretion pathway protein L
MDKAKDFPCPSDHPSENLVFGKGPMELLSRFWRWWMTELAGLVPRADARMAAHREMPLELHVTSNSAQLYRRQSLRRQLNDASCIATATSLPELLLAGYVRGKAILTFDRSLTMEREVPLARALQGEADQILASDLQRATPFKPNQVISLWQEMDRDRLKQAILRLTDVREAMALANAQGITITGLGYRPTGEAAWSQIRNPDGILWHASKDRFWRNVAIGSVVAALCSVAAYAASLNGKHLASMEVLSQRIDEARPKALERRKTIDAIAGEIAALSSLAKTRGASSGLVQVWEELARILPDDAWIQGLNLRDGKLQIEGTAKNAEALISRVEQSGLFKGARFAAPVVGQAGAGSRFVIAFEIEKVP